MSLGDHKSLAAIAVAMVKKPGATYQELAEDIGVSRATLYRFCPNRQELILRVLRHATNQLNQSIENARLSDGSPAEGLNRLVNAYVENKELVGFIAQYWYADAQLDTELTKAWYLHQIEVDKFFLRGQAEGVFRIDITAATFNDGLCWLIVGLVDSERRGRVARAGFANMIETLFLNGIRHKSL
jgi:TetR/AcrR family transcriptional repressor of mexCD-oprJ operon